MTQHRILSWYCLMIVDSRGLWYRLISCLVYVALSAMVSADCRTSSQFATLPLKHLLLSFYVVAAMESMETSGSSQTANHCTIASGLEPIPVGGLGWNSLEIDSIIMDGTEEDKRYIFQILFFLNIFQIV